MIFCHKLWFFNFYILTIRCRRLLTFQIMNPVRLKRSKSLSLKYEMLTPTLVAKIYKLEKLSLWQRLHFFRSICKWYNDNKWYNNDNDVRFWSWTQVCRFINCKLAVQSKPGPQRLAQHGPGLDCTRLAERVWIKKSWGGFEMFVLPPLKFVFRF